MKTIATVRSASFRPKAERRASSSQQLRTWVQIGSLLVNVAIGIQFYLWVDQLRRGVDGWIERPAGVEGWLPIGAMVSARHWFSSGEFNLVHPAALIILLTVLATAFLFRRAFCSWVCPVGFVSETVADVGQRLFRRNIVPPRWLDWPLRMLKYLLLAFFVWAIWFQMTPAAIAAFVYSDYNAVSDILMLRFFTDMSRTSLLILGALLLLSVVVRGFWCRYLCPYGALQGLFALLSPARIRRDPVSCIDCGRCAKACPSFIPVNRITSVQSDECTGCLSCVDACPLRNTLQMSGPTQHIHLTSRQWAAGLLILFWGGLLTFWIAGPWKNNISEERYIQMFPGTETGQYSHPGSDGK